MHVMYCAIRVKCWAIQKRCVTTTGVSKIITFFKREPKVLCRLGELICAQRNIMHHTFTVSVGYERWNHSIWQKASNFCNGDCGLHGHLISSPTRDTKKYNSEKHNNQQRGMNECRKQKPFGGHISNGKCIRAEALRYFADLRRPSF